MKVQVEFKEVEGFEVKTEVCGYHGHGISRKIILVTRIRNQYVEVVYEVWNNGEVKYEHNIHNAINRYNNLFKQ